MHSKSSTGVFHKKQVLSHLTSPSPTSDTPHTRSWSDLTSLSSGKSSQFTLVSKLKHFSVSKLTSQLAQSLSSDYQALQKNTVHSSSLSPSLENFHLSGSTSAPQQKTLPLLLTSLEFFLLDDCLLPPILMFQDLSVPVGLA